MKVVNTHERLIARPLPEVFDDLAALGTAADRLCPSRRRRFCEPMARCWLESRESDMAGFGPCSSPTK